MGFNHFQPMGYRNSDDGSFSMFICIIVTVVCLPIANLAMDWERENNYLESNHCKVVAYEVKDISGYKTLWSCDNGHYISEQVSY